MRKGIIQVIATYPKVDMKLKTKCQPYVCMSGFVLSFIAHLLKET